MVTIQLKTITFLQCLIHGVLCLVCPSTWPPYSGPPIPNIPDHFSSDMITTNIVNGATSYEMKIERMYVDAKRKLMATEQGGDFEIGGRKMIMDHNRKQAMIISKKKCNVSSISDIPLDGLRPYGNNEFNSGKQLFRFGKDYHPVYNGNFSYEDKVLDAWAECLPALGKDNDFNITVQYLFTQKNSKHGQQFFGFSATALTKNKTIMVKLINMNTGTPSPEHLQVPNDVFCNMTTTKVQLPRFPDEFEMNIEVLMLSNKTGFNARDYIDTKEKYFRSDHHHKENGIFVPVHEIHDFNTGIMYTIDVNTYDCKVKPLSNRSWDAVETGDHHHIRMKTTNEFMGIDGQRYIHEGFTTVRGIPVDVFSNMMPSRRHPGQMVLRKWYFSRPDWKIGGMEGPLNDTRVPVMLTWGRDGRKSIMNFFNYDPVETANHILWPLRACYLNNRHYMYFRLSGQYDSFGAENQRSVTNSIRDSLAKAAGISKLRVSSVLIFKSGYQGVVAVRVYVLGLPPVKGSVLVLHPKHELPLKTAVDRIRDSITSGKFKVLVKVKDAAGVVVKSLTAQKDSYYDVFVDGPDPQPPNRAKKGKAGMTAGAVVAISIAFIVIAVLLTVALMHFILKRRGIQLFQYSRHSDDPTA